MSIPLSDISDADAEAATSPVLSSNSPRPLRRSHQPNDSINSIDMRNVLGVFPNDVDQRLPRARYNTTVDPIDPEMLLSSALGPFIPPVASLPPSRPSAAAAYYSHSPHRSLSGSYRHARSTSTATAVPGGSQSPSQTPTQSHMRSLSNSSASRRVSLGRPGFGLGLDLPPSPTTLKSTSLALSPISSASSTSPSTSTPPTSANTDSKMSDSYSTTTQFSTIPSFSSSASEYSPLAKGGGEDEETTTDSSSHPAIVTKATDTIPIKGQTHGRGKSEDMTLDELSSNKQNYHTSTQSPRVPSPDIATILSVTPRPALSLSRSRSGGIDVRSQSRSQSRVPAGQRRVVSANPNTDMYPEHHHPHAIDLNRRQSEGALTANANVSAHGRTLSSEVAYLHNITNGLPPPSNTKAKKISFRSAPSANGYYDREIEEYDEALERVLEGGGSDEEGVGVGVIWGNTVKNNQRGRRSGGNVEQEEGGGGGDSDSSLDLHTPLPYVCVSSVSLKLTIFTFSHLMLRHGLLSPNSKLLPQADSRAATPLDGRPGSILSIVSNGEL